MNLLTLNCHSWQETNQMEKLKYLAQVIAEEDIEVIALQEVNQLMKSPLLSGEVREDNFIYLLSKELEKLGKNYSYRWDYHHVGYDIYHEGTGVLFKGSAEESFGEFIGKTKDTNSWKTRKFTMISKIIQGEKIDFYSCRMGWWKDSDNPFEEQVDELLDFAQKRGNRYFLMGDFNNEAGISGEGYDYIISKGLRDTYLDAERKDSGITVARVIAGWEGRSRNPKRIDFIFTNTRSEIKSSLVIFNGENKEIISDHFGIILEL